MSTIVQSGVVAGTAIRWELGRTTPNPGPALASMAELVGPLVPPETRAILEHIALTPALASDERLETLELVLAGVRTYAMKHGRLALLAQRLDLVAREIREARKAARRDHLWIVAGDGQRRLVGVVELSIFDATWWGTMADELGGTTLGPHEEETAGELIGRMVRRACGLPDVYVMPELPELEIAAPPPAPVLRMCGGLEVVR